VNTSLGFKLLACGWCTMKAKNDEVMHRCSQSGAMVLISRGRQLGTTLSKLGNSNKLEESKEYFEVI
jgi:hypothetical protein